MKQRLIISFIYVCSVSGYIFLPYFLVINNTPPKTYEGLSVFEIWLCGIFCMILLAICIAMLLFVVSFIYKWYRWVKTGVWGEVDQVKEENPS